MYDCIVVGAGPAGTSSAYWLAKKGFKILLLDKAIFPRDKVDGDGLTNASVRCLEDIGLSFDTDFPGAFPIKGFSMFSPNGSYFHQSAEDLIRQYGYSFVYPRIKLDKLLLEKVASGGVEVVQGLNVYDVKVDEKEGVRVFGISKEGALKKAFSGKLIIGADGVNSTVAKKTGLYKPSVKDEVIAARGYFKGVSDLSDYAEIHFLEELLPGYLWIFPFGDGTANVGLGIYKKSLNGVQINVRDSFERIISTDPYIKERFKDASLISDIKGWPLVLASFKKKRQTTRTLLVGDAGAFIDPITGEGVYYALKSGKIAADIASEALASGRFSKDYLSGYEKRWKKEFGTNYRASIFLRMCFKYPGFVNFFVRRLNKRPHLAESYGGIMGNYLPRKSILNGKFLLKLLF